VTSAYGRGRSLKTQQHASRIARVETQARDLPGPVDISSGRPRSRRASRSLRSAAMGLSPGMTILPAIGALG
jgi:hypothetical protein